MTTAYTPPPTKNILEVLQTKRDLIKAQIQMALPRHVTADRMLRLLTTEVNKNTDLLKCSITSILRAVIQCSQLGLEPSGALGHAYLIPYNNECQFIVGYRGMIDLAMRSGKIINIRAKAVYANDHFEYQDGVDIVLKHTPNQEERGDFIGAYAVARFANVVSGSYQVEFMYKNEIEKIRSRSKAKRFSPWETDYEEMAKKTVIRRLFKYLPISVEMQRAVILDEAADRGNQAEFFEATDIFRGLMEPEPQNKSEQVAAMLNTNKQPPET